MYVCKEGGGSLVEFCLKVLKLINTRRKLALTWNWDLAGAERVLRRIREGSKPLFAYGHCFVITDG